MKRFVGLTSALFALSASATSAPVVTSEQAINDITNVPSVDQLATSIDQHGVHLDSDSVLNQALGLGANLTTATDHLKAYTKQMVDMELQAKEYELWLKYQQDLEELKFDLAEIAIQLQYCDWVCVDNCALWATGLAQKAACIETCGCYQASGSHYFQEPHPTVFTATVRILSNSNRPTNLFCPSHRSPLESEARAPLFRSLGPAPLPPPQYQWRHNFKMQTSTTSSGSSGSDQSSGSAGVSVNVGGSSSTSTTSSGSTDGVSVGVGSDGVAVNVGGSSSTSGSSSGSTSGGVSVGVGSSGVSVGVSSGSGSSSGSSTGSTNGVSVGVGSEGVSVGVNYGSSTSTTTETSSTAEPAQNTTSEPQQDQAQSNAPINYIGVPLPAQPSWMGLEEYNIYAYEYQLDYLNTYPPYNAAMNLDYQNTLLEVEHQIKSWESKADLMQAQWEYQNQINMAPTHMKAQLEYQYGMEMTAMFQDYVREEVARVLQRMEQSYTVTKSNVTSMLQSAAQALGCDTNCVGSCSNAAWTMQESATCLDRCFCYGAPTTAQTTQQAPPPSDQYVYSNQAQGYYYGSASTTGSQSTSGYSGYYYTLFNTVAENSYTAVIVLGSVAALAGLGAAFCMRGKQEKEGVYEALL